MARPRAAEITGPHARIHTSLNLRESQRRPAKAGPSTC
ncbi:hypothetical protein GXY_11693 [Novacetimonas hansenii ATCC 23769]|uniref:Uncharacterized protein n=1 Tax=Novacetimonas hansenii ATCC 23769 TaxID=714995 RepID=D5QGR6_NOVHA|nr:hypothetical protein GXY_11693 [Novacetimonas hansenii ATCC 23769]